MRTISIIGLITLPGIIGLVLVLYGTAGRRRGRDDRVTLGRHLQSWHAERDCERGNLWRGHPRYPDAD